MDSSLPLSTISIAVSGQTARIKRNIPRNAGETRYPRETLASKVASSPKRGWEAETRGKRINATRYTEEGNPGNAFANQSSSPGAHISSKEPSVFPSRPSCASFSLPISFFSSSSSAFVWSSSTGTRVSHVSSSHPRSRTIPSSLAGKGRIGKKKREGREGNAVTRENPLRNVFSPCTACGTILLAK